MYRIPKEFILISICITITQISLGQSLSPKYNDLIKKAVVYYHTKNYRVSATTYSLAFKSIGWKGVPDDRYNASCAWALAGVPDSAFFQLNKFVTKGNYTNYEQISAEHDLISLHKDKRWKPLLENIKQNEEKKEAKLNKPLIRELDSIRSEDQQYRLRTNDIKANYGMDSKEMKDLWKTINEKDSINLIKVKNILDTDGWLGSDVVGDNGNTTLFLVIQHSDIKTQEKYLPMMREAVKNGNARASELALLEDRIAMRQGKKQIYGSQIITNYKTGKDTLAPIEDFANVDKRRAEVGLGSLEDYVSQWGIVLKKKAIKTNYATPHNDFATAIEIHDSIVGPLNVYEGFGKQLDFKRPAPFTYKENNTVWFKFTIDHDTVLTFDLVPNYSKNDYDFILFKCPTADCIDNIRTNTISPDRQCFSINYDKSGSTGLSEYVTATYAPGGGGPGYVSGLPIKAGETIYLMVDFPYAFSSSKGFTLYFYNYWPKKPEYLKKSHPLKNAIVLENVLFESNKTILLKESLVALDKLMSQLQANKTMKIEIRGHTDNVGDETTNQKLSEDRAKTIVDYLISKKIDKNRLSFKGFGNKQPIASNDTEEGRKKNRRAEFIIVTK